MTPIASISMYQVGYDGTVTDTRAHINVPFGAYKISLLLVQVQKCVPEAQC